MADVYVSVAGSGTQDGTSAANALSAATLWADVSAEVNDGDTCHFAAGDYTASGDLNINTAWTSTTTFIADGPAALERFLINGRANTHVVGPFEVSDPAQAACSVFNRPAGNCENNQIRKLWTHDSQLSGVGLGTISIAGTVTNPTGCVIESCYSDTDGQHGCGLLGSTDGAYNRWNFARANSANSSGWGIYGTARSVKWNDALWTDLTGGVWERDIEDASWPTYSVQFPLRTDATHDRWLTEGTYNSTVKGEWAQSGIKLQINVGTSNPTNVVVTTVHGVCNNPTLADSCGQEMNVAFDGVGIGLDTSVTSGRIERCESHTNTQGFSMNGPSACHVEGCIAWNNTDDGLHMLTTTGANIIAQCTSDDATTNAFAIERNDGGNTDTIYNCIGTGSSVGFFGDDIDGTADVVGCLAHNNTTDLSGVTTPLPRTNVEGIDPEYLDKTTGDLRVDGGSRAIRGPNSSGFEWWASNDAQPHDFDGRRYAVTGETDASANGAVDIGAFSVRADLPYTRKAVALPASVLLAGVDIAKARKV